MLKELHAAKIINLDASIGTVLRPADNIIDDPGSKVGWYVVGGDHYVLVCGLTELGGDVSKVAESVKADIQSKY